MDSINVAGATKLLVVFIASMTQWGNSNHSGGWGSISCETDHYTVGFQSFGLFLFSEYFSEHKMVSVILFLSFSQFVCRSLFLLPSVFLCLSLPLVLPL